MTSTAIAQGSPPRAFIWLVIGLTLGVLAIRLALNLTHPGALGVDGGAYILSALRLMGEPVPSGLDFQRAILGPGYLLTPFLSLFGLDAGYKIWEAIFSTFPIIPAAALLAYRMLPRRLALIATIFVALNPWNWEMVITGALPLIGIALIFLALWGLINITTGGGTKWDKAAVAGGIALIPYINQTSTGLAAVSIPVFVGSMCLFCQSWRPLRYALPWLTLGALLALPAILLFYGDVVFGSTRMSFPGPKIFVSPGYRASWLVFFYALPIVFSTLKLKQDPALKSLALVVFAHSALSLFNSYDEAIINIFFRSQHLATPLLMILGTWYVSREVAHIKNRVAVVLGVLAFAIVLAGGSAYTYQRQAYYSDMLTPDMLEAMELIPNHQSETIITTNFMSGLWVAAYEQTPTAWLFAANPPEYWQAQYRETQCVLGWRTDCDPLTAARDINARWVLVDMRFPHITDQEPPLWGAPEDTWSPTLIAPWLDPLYAKGTVRLWRIKWDA